MLNDAMIFLVMTIDRYFHYTAAQVAQYLRRTIIQSYREQREGITAERERYDRRTDRRHKRDRKSHSSDFLHNAEKVGNEADRDSGVKCR